MQNSNVSDEDLMVRVAYGDTTALSQLYDRYNRQIFSMAASMLHDRMQAEDLSQDIFVALWTRARTFHSEKGMFKHWFLHLAHNRVIDEIRRQRRQNARDYGHPLDDLIKDLPSSHNTEDLAVISAMASEALRALSKLPKEQRSVLALAYLEGFTQREIARMIALPLGTVKTRMRIGLNKLRDSLMEKSAKIL